MHRPHGLLLLFVSWLVQIPLVVEARPEFGIVGPVEGSSALDITTDLLFTQFKQLTTLLNIRLVSQSSNLGAILVPLQSLTEAFGTAGQTFANTLWAAIDSESNLAATFDPVIAALNKLQMMRENVLQETLDALETMQAMALHAQLTEVFLRTKTTINNITGALVQLIGSLRNAQTNADVSTTLVKLVNTYIRELVADVTLLNHTIRSAAEGLREADKFLAQLSYAVGNATAATTLALQRFQSKLERYAEAIESDASCLLERYQGFEGKVHCTFVYLYGSSSEECVLKSTAETLVHLVTHDFERLVCVLKRHYESLGDRSKLSELLRDGYDDILELGNVLANITASNGPYAQLCHNAYASRIVELPRRVSDGVGQCLSSESKRLKSLQSSLAHLLPTVLYDVEELLPSLQACIRQPDDDQVECIHELGELYERLASRTTEKLQLIEQYSFLETDASEERLKACVLQSSYTVLGQQLVRLRREIRECAVSGPDCSQDVNAPVDCELYPQYPDYLADE